MAALVCITEPAAQAQAPLVAEIADPVVEIRTAFSGTSLLVFGAIKCPVKATDTVEGCAIAATIKGPPEAVTVRRKTRKSGIWVNGSAAVFSAVPGYYAYAATAPLQRIITAPQQDLLEFGAQNLKFGETGDAGEAFRAGLIDARRRQALYLDERQPVKLRDETLFRMTFPIPANVPIGDYTVAIYTFHNAKLIAQTQETLRIEKAGFEAYVTLIAQRLSLLYGVVSVILAFAIGLAASYALKS